MLGEEQGKSTARIIREYSGLFGEFYQPWIERTASDLSIRLLSLSLEAGIELDIEAVARESTQFGAALLVQIGTRSLIDDFQRVVSTRDPRDTDSFTAYAWALGESSRRTEILTRLPVLKRLLDEVVVHVVSNTTEIIRQYCDDRQGLEGFGMSQDTKVIGLAFSSGDAHRDGRRVGFLRTSSGTLVYKPRSTDVDILIARLAEVVNRVADGECQITIPRSVDCGDHGWQEFIVGRRAKNDDEFLEYYRRVGGLLAFFTALGGQDMHYENIIAVGPDPVPIDLETGIRVRHYDPSTDPLFAAVELEFRYGVGASMILPNVGTEARFDIDLSAAGMSVTQRSSIMRSLQLTNSGTAAIAMEALILLSNAPLIFRKIHDALGKWTT